MLGHEYSFPVYGTQGGGLVRWLNGVYIFVEKPDCPGLDVGDKLPEEWGVVPVNDAARDAMDDNYEFSRSLDELFNSMFEKAERGEMTYDQIEAFFPPEIRTR